MTPEELYERDILEFTDDEGHTLLLQVTDYFFYNGEEYALLAEYDEEEEEGDGGQACIICRVIREEDDEEDEEESFEVLEDQVLAGKLIEIFNTKLAEQEEEEDE